MVLQLQTSAAKSGLVNNKYTTWKKKPAADRTWALAKTFFREAFADVDDLQAISAKSLLGANAATHQPPAAAGRLQPEVVQAMDNLAMAALAKNATVEEMSASLKTLMENNSTLTKEVARLTALCNKCPPNDGAGAKPACDPDGYCWTHGYRCKVGHNSKTCTKRADGHKEESTRKNPMGGNMRVKGWGNEPNGSERE